MDLVACIFLIALPFLGSCTGSDHDTNSTSVARSNETLYIDSSESLFSIISKAKSTSDQLNATSDDVSMEFISKAKGYATGNMTIDTKLECSVNHEWCVTIRLCIGRGRKLHTGDLLNRKDGLMGSVIPKSTPAPEEANDGSKWWDSTDFF